MDIADLTAPRNSRAEIAVDVATILSAAIVTNAAGEAVEISAAISSFIAGVRRGHEAGSQLLFLGIGADAGSASHMAIDFSKNGNVRALSLDAAAAVTCLGNDLGFERVFAKQVELHGRTGDTVVMIGGRGADPILESAANVARETGMKLVTVTTSLDENPLSRLGDLNFRLPVEQRGAATIAQLAMCHAWVDFLCGWRRDRPLAPQIDR